MPRRTHAAALVAALAMSSGCSLYLTSREDGVKVKHVAAGVAIDTGLIGVTALGLWASSDEIDPQGDLGFWGTVGIAAAVVLVGELLILAISGHSKQ